jgi:ABC-2 type transport system ATP-binding protein
MTVLSLTDVTIRYGDFEAVTGLSLAVAAGEILGLLGPNGSGKSSTLGAVVGDRRPVAGRIQVAGRIEKECPLEYRRCLGLVPQEMAVYEDLTAEQNLRLFGGLYGLDRDTLRQRMAWALGFVRLQEQARRAVRTYSGGMQRRLNLACAILHRPPLLLLDEPTVGLDIQSREAIFACLRQLRDEGTAMVFTTHHLAEAEQLCDRLVIMDRGRLIASGSLGELCGLVPGWRTDAAQTHPGPHRPPTRGLERVFLELTGRSLRDS